MDRKDRKTRKLKRQESTTGKSIQPCNNFKPNVWRPNKCVNCFFPINQHATSSAPVEDPNQAEIKRLDNLLEAGLVQPAEYERRKAAFLSPAQISRM